MSGMFIGFLIGGSALALAMISLFILFLNQEKLIFRPEKIPSDYNFEFQHEFEELFLEPKRGIRLNAVLFKSKESKGLVLYFHGHRGSIASWGYVADDIVENGWDCLVYDYRSYGKSNGKIISELSLHRDAQFIYDVMSERYKGKDIILFGQSLGSGIAAKLATENKIKALLLVTPYFNFTDVVRFHYPFLPVRFLLKYKLTTNKSLPQIKVPVYLIHGTKDELIQYESSIRLSSLSDNIQLTTVNGGLHGNLQDFEEYQMLLSEILKT